MPLDPRTETNIATLLPRAQAQARRLMEALRVSEALRDAAVSAKIISGTRTFKEQDALYAKGRDKEGKTIGPTVTNARGGFSNHNFGIAWDIGLFDSAGKYLAESPLYAKVGAIGKALGLAWGGDWQSFRDEPHFECKTGKTIAELRALVATHGGDTAEARAAIDALLAPPPPKPAPAPPPPPPSLPTVTIALGSKVYAIDAYFVASRVWVRVSDFCDYFGGAVTAETATAATVTLHGETRTLAAQQLAGHACVRFADLNDLLGYQFTFNSQTRRLTLRR